MRVNQSDVEREAPPSSRFKLKWRRRGVSLPFWFYELVETHKKTNILILAKKPFFAAVSAETLGVIEAAGAAVALDCPIARQVKKAHQRQRERERERERERAEGGEKERKR